MLTYSSLLSGYMVYFTINWSFSERLPLIGEFHISNCKFIVSTILWNPNSSLYNKEYCRGCGSFLKVTSLCNVCLEYVSWKCGKCYKVDDVTHSHTYRAYAHVSGA